MTALNCARVKETNYINLVLHFIPCYFNDAHYGYLHF